MRSVGPRAPAPGLARAPRLRSFGSGRDAAARSWSPQSRRAGGSAPVRAAGGSSRAPGPRTRHGRRARRRRFPAPGG
ncbi:MAG: hypothetical protein F4X15_14800, partial [Gemmatimonadetes bacterium]|nr:hypothetical protein [Gemmatimonadota bacterium]